MSDILDISIWGREFSLPIEYDCYEGEEITDQQRDAMNNFMEHLDWIDKNKRKVEIYCKEDVSEDEENTKKDNIFSYIIPASFFIKRDKEHPRVALMCNYRYDPEHGLAVVFSADGEVVIGQQDIIL